MPQRRDTTGFLVQKPALTIVQARNIVANYVKRLNPDLKIGKITDNGRFYVAEIIADGNQVIQHLGIDKKSGRLILIN